MRAPKNVPAERMDVMRDFFQSRGGDSVRLCSGGVCGAIRQVYHLSQPPKFVRRCALLVAATSLKALQPLAWRGGRLFKHPAALNGRACNAASESEAENSRLGIVKLQSAPSHHTKNEETPRSSSIV